MSLRSLAAPRRVNDLDAGIAAGALLLSRGLAGFLTGKPARLALQPTDGGAGTVLDLPVDAAQEVALLSSDSAVVLGAGGVLWALSDLRDQTKAKQIGREVRALCARPLGDSAMALGEGGQVLALTVSGRDVGVRPLSTKGSVLA